MNYVILSEGGYSDYCQTWYGGERLIEQDEFYSIGKKIGDEVTTWFFSLPERGWGRISPDGEEISQYDLKKIWNQRMVEWLKENGYSEIVARAEINVAYSEIPVSKSHDQT